MKLLLFDIDGTLQNINGTSMAHRWPRAVEAYLGHPMTGEMVLMPGRTDPMILLELLMNEGVTEEEARLALPELMDDFVPYFNSVYEQIQQEVYLLPGVKELLDRLHKRKDVVLGLVTGNLQSVAELKLRVTGIDVYFDWESSGFSSDHYERPEIPPFALNRARAKYNQPFTGPNVWIIGDSPADYQCAQPIRANTLLVCTSGHSLDELENTGATAAIKDFSDTESVLTILGLS